MKFILLILLFYSISFSQYFKDNEPYYEDDLWHITGSSSTYKISYDLLHNYINDPTIIASTISLSIWSMVEVLDAYNGVGFSLIDLRSDCIGILFQIIKDRYNLPISIRVAVKDFDRFTIIFYDYDKMMNEHYDIMNSEIIVYLKYYYIGLAISKKSNNNNNIYGATIGYDVLKNIKMLNYISDYFNVSISLTVWQ